MADASEPLISARGAVVGHIERLAAHPWRAPAPTVSFPVRGAFNWGQSSARFGAARSGRSHEGQDVFARTGTPLVAVRDGLVVETGTDGGRGNYLAIHDPAADRTYVYLHMLRPTGVAVGERVRSGARVGAVGCSGSCSGDHVHFEIRRGKGTAGAAEDPLPRLARWARSSGARATLPPGAH